VKKSARLRDRAALLRAGDPPDIPRADRPTEWRVAFAAAAATVVGYAVFSLVALTLYPPVYSDEPWELSSPIAILRTGRNALPIFGESYSTALYYNVYVAAGLRIAGISLEAGRAFSVVHGLGLLAASVLIAREFGARVPAIAAISLPFLFPFVEASHYVRPDVIAAFYAYLALYLALRAARRPAWALAAGASAALAVGIFPIAAWIALAGPVVLLTQRPARRRLALFGAGLGVGLLPLAAFIAAEPAEYLRFLTKFGGSSLFALRYREGGPLFTLADQLSREPQRYDGVVAFAGSWWYLALTAAATLLAVVTIARARQPLLLVLLALPPAFLAVAGANKGSLYLVMLVPMLAVALAFAWPRRRWSLTAALALVAVAYVVTVAGKLAPIATSNDDIAAAYSRVAILPGSLVIGDPVTYAYFLNRPVDFRTLHFFTRFDDFALDDGPTNAAKISAEARRRPVYLIYAPVNFFGTMSHFDVSGNLPSFEAFVRARFAVTDTIDLDRTPYGDYHVIVTRYVDAAASGPMMGGR